MTVASDGDGPPRVFLIAGMTRTGTTSLYYNLSRHPEIFVPHLKETNFFSVNFHRGMRWYSDLYRDMASCQVGLDASPLYFLDTESLPRIQSLDAPIKVVLGVRDPIDWSFSAYRQVASYTFAMPPYREFLDRHTLMIDGSPIPIRLANGHIRTTLAAYRQAFQNRLLLYDFRLLREDPLAVLRAITDFVGAREPFGSELLDSRHYNASGRRNLRMLNRVRQSGALGVLSRHLPQGPLQALRRTLDLLGSPSHAPITNPIETHDNLEIARHSLAQDQGAVAALFASSPIILGSGEPVSPRASG